MPRRPLANAGEFLVVARNVPNKIEWQDLKDHIRPHVKDGTLEYTEVIEAPGRREKYAGVVASTEQEACQIYQVLRDKRIDSRTLLAQWFRASREIVNGPHIQTLLAEVAPAICAAPQSGTSSHLTELRLWPQNRCRAVLTPQIYSNHRCEFCTDEVTLQVGPGGAVIPSVTVSPTGSEYVGPPTYTTAYTPCTGYTMSPQFPNATAMDPFSPISPQLGSPLMGSPYGHAASQSNARHPTSPRARKGTQGKPIMVQNPKRSPPQKEQPPEDQSREPEEPERPVVVDGSKPVKCNSRKTT